MTLPPRLGYVKKGRDGKLRSPVHLEFVRRHLCVLYLLNDCYGKIEACHARDVAPRGHGGGKPDDCFVFSACQKHHKASEKREVAFGEQYGINILDICLEFAAASPVRLIREAAYTHAPHLRPTPTKAAQ